MRGAASSTRRSPSAPTRRNRESMGRRNEWTARSLALVGDIQRRRGRLAEARAADKRSFAILRKKLGPDHVVTATVAVQLAEVSIAEGRAREAVALCRRAAAGGSI